VTSLLQQHTGTDTTAGTFRPQLTSLIDVMTILLVFLLKSFSVEGNLVTPSPDLALPLSSSRQPASPLPSVEITRQALLVNGNHIATLESFATADSLLIPPLYKWMTAEQAKRPADKERPEEAVLIESDRETQFHIVKRVMYTCSKAGYQSFSVLVIQEGE
jgi:biopolymer transport protein ExbD